ncbi:MAG: glycoside hydrolase family 65 protein [Acidimicrobiales bacterium]|nr:glycoside hydrolase family 65 protein [Acidimicrobiales bacterium]
MTGGSAYEVEPWRVRESRLDLDNLARSESMFALSNGHIGMRGNLDEGEPHGLPGTYLNSVYEQRPLPYAEAGYGYPESSQTVINVTNGKLIRLLVDDEPFDIRYGRLDTHERALDLRAGTLVRDADWTSPAGCPIRMSSTRLVSLTQRAVAAICYEVTPLDHQVRLVVQSELVANEAIPAAGGDPRVAAALKSPLTIEEHAAHDGIAVMVHRTQRSDLLVAAAMDHVVDAPGHIDVDVTSSPEVSRFTVTTQLEKGQTLRLVKFLGYGWSATRSRPAVHDQVMAAVTGAKLTGWDGLLAEQRAYLDRFWDGADVEVDGDPEIQQAVRFALFHVLQGGARAEGRPIAAKGLTGPGYDGHTFWDTETFVLPALTYTVPRAAADALRWRQTTLPAARARAHQLGLEGAAFPWRTISGEECSGYWPAGTAAFHINADVADAVVHYLDATEDSVFEREVALELLVETARLWRSLGHRGPDGSFRIDGVTGPDEYSAIADNNVYTNLMAAQNLRFAAELAAHHPDAAADLGVTQNEVASWREAADTMTVPYDERLGIHSQSDRFTEHARWDFDRTAPEQYPLLLHVPYFDLYRKQVVKQADLVLAMHLCGDAFTAEQKARNFAYYEAITVRDSSLSACTQAVIAAELGHLELAYDYLGEAALMDFGDLEHNTGDGLHMASLAGVWIGLVAGLGGMRASPSLRFAPRLPHAISRLAFRVCYRGRHLRVVVTASSVTYELLDGAPITIFHHGVPLELDGTPQEQAIPPIEASPPPTQPPGRSPTRRTATPDLRSG